MPSSSGPLSGSESSGTGAGHPAALPVHMLVLRHARTRPEQAALIYPLPGHPGVDGYRDVTFGELASRVGRCAAGLRRRGVGVRDRVVVLVPMSPDLYVVLLAIV